MSALPLLDRGATWADSPKVVVEQSDVIFTMVGFPREVREIYFGKTGLLAGAQVGSILVDVTTTEPSLSKDIHSAARAKGVHFVTRS